MKIINCYVLIVCVSGIYGLDCMYNCLFNCIDGLCNNENGYCICIYGMKGFFYCNESKICMVICISILLIFI